MAEEKRLEAHKQEVEKARSALQNLAVAAAAYRGTLQEHNALQAAIEIVAKYIPEAEGNGEETGKAPA